MKTDKRFLGPEIIGFLIGMVLAFVIASILLSCGPPEVPGVL